MGDLRESLEQALGSSYTLGRELGGGGMSRVFVATDTRLRRDVVIKVLAPELAAGISAERFEREIRMAAGLQHPNIVPVLAAGDVGGLPYYTMPLVAGASLRERMSEVTGRRIGERVEILRDVARALSYAHRNAIVHRDIKPENVLLTDGAAAVTDFGIAKALSEARGATGADAPGGGTKAALTGLGTSLGTPAYMAPEQAAGDSVDQRADVYSWGMIAWELLAGRHPFADRASAQQLIMAQLSAIPPRLDTVVADISPGLASLIARCLDKDQARRPANGGELLAELEATRTGPEGLLPRRRSRTPMIAAAVAGLVVLAVAAWSLQSRRAGTTDQQVVAVTPFRVGGADPSLYYLREGMLDLISAKLGGGVGARAIDSRTLLAAWKKAGGDDRADLDEAAALRMAASLGAGELLSGDVVGTSGKLTLNARIVSVADGKTRVLSSVEGPSDSLTILVDRLCAKLLSLRAGESERSLAQLTSTSLPALKHYLEGKRLYRQGKFRPAAIELMASLAADTNFVHPALTLAMIGRWAGAFPYFRPGADVVYRLRSKLGPLERAKADNIVSDDYPRDPTMAERLAAAEKWVAMDPQNIEAIGHRADVILHFGHILGITDANERARDGFLRVMNADSTYMIYFSHLPFLFAEMGDSMALRRLGELAAADTAHAVAVPAIRVLEANARGDSAATDRLLSRISSMDLRALGILRASNMAAVCPRCADASHAEVASRKLTPAQERGGKASASVNALVRGQPAAFASLQRQLPPTSLNLVRYAFADGDSALAEETAAAVRKRMAAPPEESRERARVMDWLALGIHSGAHGDTTALRSALAELRAVSIRPDSVDAIEVREHAAMALEVELAVLGRHPDLARRVARLDSAQGHAPAGGLTMVPSAFILSRAYERLGDNRKALAAVRSIPQQWSGGDYHPTQMRQAGRLAEALGERDKALEYYRWYLAYRRDPEPALRAERDEVKRAVAQLESKGR